MSKRMIRWGTPKHIQIKRRADYPNYTKPIPGKKDKSVCHKTKGEHDPQWVQARQPILNWYDHVCSHCGKKINWICLKHDDPNDTIEKALARRERGDDYVWG